MERCDECGGRIDRPSLLGCEVECHPIATVAQRIAAAIEDDLRIRNGMGWAGVDEETIEEIRDSWAEIIERLS